MTKSFVVLIIENLRSNHLGAQGTLNVIFPAKVLDGGTVAAFNTYAKEVPDLPEGPTLLLEFEGASEASVQV